MLTRKTIKSRAAVAAVVAATLISPMAGSRVLGASRSSPAANRTSSFQQRSFSNSPSRSFSRPSPPSSQPSPSFNRPSPSFSRPNSSFNRPSPSVSRPTPAPSRPSSPSINSRPSFSPSVSQTPGPMRSSPAPRFTPSPRNYTPNSRSFSPRTFRYSPNTQNNVRNSLPQPSDVGSPRATDSIRSRIGTESVTRSTPQAVSPSISEQTGVSRGSLFERLQARRDQISSGSTGSSAFRRFGQESAETGTANSAPGGPPKLALPAVQGTAREHRTTADAAKPNGRANRRAVPANANRDATGYLPYGRSPERAQRSKPVRAVGATASKS
jgi:hypothetical protein